MATVVDLTKPGIEDWIQKQKFGASLDNDEVRHVAHCMMSIVNWYNDERCTPGDFIGSVLQNDLSEAIHNADDINLKALRLYVSFLYNEMPGDWKQKAKKFYC